MRRGQVALIAALAIAVVVIWAAVWRTVSPAFADASGTPSGAKAVGAAPSPSSGVASGMPSTDVPSPTPAPTEVPALTPTEPPTPTPTEPPTRSAAPTTDPTTDADPRVAWVAFLAHLDDLRPEAATLTDDLVSAADDGDRAAVRDGAVAILRFADRERDWLSANPPAPCFADAHAAAGSVVEAYAAVAERAIAWVESGDGLEGLGALADLIAEAGVARDRLEDLGAALGAATCLD